MRDVENAWPPGTPCEFAWKGRWYRAISNGVVDDVLELQEVRARAVTHVELDEVAGSVVPKGTHLEWTADDERKSAALARATAGEPAKCNKPGADSSRKKQPAPEASESAPKQARKQPTDAQQAARSREPDSSDEDASESAPKQARKQSADAQQAARSREPDSSDEDASESAPKQARKQPATSRSQEPDSSEEESGSASMSDDEDGAVDWLKEGQTSGHAFISKRVAIQHDGELAKGTITMWVPANEDAGDEALFHVKHDDGDSEDLDEDEAKPPPLPPPPPCPTCVPSLGRGGNRAPRRGRDRGQGAWQAQGIGHCCCGAGGGRRADHRHFRMRRSLRLPTFP